MDIYYRAGLTAQSPVIKTQIKQKHQENKTKTMWLEKQYKKY